MTVRLAVRADAETIGHIDVLAGQRFREIPVAAAAAAEKADVAEIRRLVDGSHAWVAVEDDAVVGFVLAEELDGTAFVDQVSVLPDRQGRGHGKALLNRVQTWAGQHGLPAVTLTTFDQVPWNRPLYEHLGFRVLTRAECGPGLTAAIAAEEARFGAGTRVAMRRDVPGHHAA